MACLKIEFCASYAAADEVGRAGARKQAELVCQAVFAARKEGLPITFTASGDVLAVAVTVNSESLKHIMKHLLESGLMGCMVLEIAGGDDLWIFDHPEEYAVSGLDITVTDVSRSIEGAQCVDLNLYCETHGFTWEWCAECQAEVLLRDNMVGQKCPVCGADIWPCSFCQDTYGGCVSPCRISA